MAVLLYFAGLVIGVTIFLYVLSTVRDTKEKLAVGKTAEQMPPAENIKPGTISFRKRPALPPGTRICPMCGSALTKFEGLYASRIDMANSSKLMIMGCRYCYKEENGGDSTGKAQP